MPDTARQVVKARTVSHSDVATGAPARAHQSSLTERQFGDQLVRTLREAKGDVTLRNLKEDWVPTDDGMTHELSVELHVEPSE